MIGHHGDQDDNHLDDQSAGLITTTTTSTTTTTTPVQDHQETTRRPPEDHDQETQETTRPPPEGHHASPFTGERQRHGQDAYPMFTNFCLQLAQELPECVPCRFRAIVGNCSYFSRHSNRWMVRLFWPRYVNVVFNSREVRRGAFVGGVVLGFWLGIGFCPAIWVDGPL